MNELPAPVDSLHCPIAYVLNVLHSGKDWQAGSCIRGGSKLLFQKVLPGRIAHMKRTETYKTFKVSMQFLHKQSHTLHCKLQVSSSLPLCLNSTLVHAYPKLTVGHEIAGSCVRVDLIVDLTIFYSSSYFPVPATDNKLALRLISSSSSCTTHLDCHVIVFDTAYMDNAL